MGFQRGMAHCSEVLKTSIISASNNEGQTSPPPKKDAPKEGVSTGGGGKKKDNAWALGWGKRTITSNADEKERYTMERRTSREILKIASVRGECAFLLLLSADAVNYILAVRNYLRQDKSIAETTNGRVRTHSFASRLLFYTHIPMIYMNIYI